MIRVKINYFGYMMKKTLRNEEEEQVAEGSTVGNLLDCLTDRYHYDFSQNGSLMILYNQKGILQLKGRDTPLEDGADIAFLPKIAGG